MYRYEFNSLPASSLATQFVVLLMALVGMRAEAESTTASTEANGNNVAIAGEEVDETANDVFVSQASPEAFQDSAHYLSPDEYRIGDERRWLADGSQPRRSTSLRPLPTAVVGGLLTGGAVALHATMFNAWWNDEQREFSFKDDWNSTLKIDKIGHFFGGYFSSYLVSEGLMVAGVSRDAAVVWGAATGLLFQTWVEVEDGFAENWGFSWTDMLSNSLGAGFFVVHHYVPETQYFTPKWQFVPPEWVDAPRVSTTWIDQYNSVTAWLSVDVHHFLPAAAQGYWPEWLNLALGYGIHQTEDELSRRYMVALDYNLIKLLPDGGGFLNWLRQTANYFKLPSPTIEFGRVTRAYLLFPFEFGL